MAVRFQFKIILTYWLVKLSILENIPQGKRVIDQDEEWRKFGNMEPQIDGEKENKSTFHVNCLLSRHFP